MRKTYKCSNIKFCMEDENQRRTWEYLRGLSRKDGSYGKVLSDVFAGYLDGYGAGQGAGEKNLLDAGEAAPGMAEGKMEQLLKEMLSGMFLEMREALAAEIRQSLAEYACASDPGGRTVFPQPDEAREQTQEPELSEDMMAFAFGMGG